MFVIAFELKVTVDLENFLVDLRLCSAVLVTNDQKIA